LGRGHVQVSIGKNLRWVAGGAKDA
jgi:hypothetical protein